MNRPGPISRVVACLVLLTLLSPPLLLAPGNVAAQSPFPGFDTACLSVGGLEGYFDRADDARDVRAWLFEAERGLKAVADEHREEARRLLLDRLSRFLGRSLEEQLPAPDTASLIAKMDALDMQFLYATVDGEKARDSAGDPLLRGYAGLGDDRGGWRAAVGSWAETLLGSWQDDAESVYHEVLCRLDPEYRQAVEPTLATTLADYVSSVRREFERMSLQRESRLLRARMQDSYSLRSKSEDESAEALTTRLVRRLEPRRDEPTVPERPLVTKEDPDAWAIAEGAFLRERLSWEEESQKAYREAEAAWDRAFGRLEDARSHWLAALQKQVQDGRATWAKAVRMYDEELARSVGNLALAAAEERHSIRRDIETRFAAYSQAVAIVSLAESNCDYLSLELQNVRTALQEERLAAEGAIAANRRDSDAIEALLGSFFPFRRHRHNPVSNLSNDDDADVGGERYQEYDAMLSYHGISHTSFHYLDYSWSTIRVDDDNEYVFTGEFRPAHDRRRLVREYNAYRFADSIVRLDARIHHRERERAAVERQVAQLLPEIAFLEEEVAYWRDLESTNRASAFETMESIDALDGRYVNELAGGSISPRQRELARRARQGGLLEHQRDIARTVAEYARDRSSGRATEAQTMERLENARRRYAEAEAAHRERIDALEGATASLSQYHEGIEAARGRLRIAQSRFVPAKRAYHDLWMAWVEDGGDQEARRESHHGSVESARSSLEEASETLDKARSDYVHLLEGFDVLSTRHREEQSALEASNRDLREARRELQTATELFEYASHGYLLTENNPEDILRRREEELRRAQRVYTMLASIKEADVTAPGDPIYGRLATIQRSLREAKSFLLYAGEALEHEIGAVAGDVNRLRLALVDGSYDLFRLPEEHHFDPDFDALAVDGALHSPEEMARALPRFDDEDPRQFVADATRYLNNEPSRCLSTDIARWSTAMAALAGTELLRDFGLALNREAAAYQPHAADMQSIDLYAEGNQVYRTVLRHDKIGSIDASSVRSLIARRGDEAAARINQNPTTKRLYTYFKALYVTDHLAIDTSYIGEDISGIAFEEARAKTQRARDYYDSWDGLRRVTRTRLRRTLRRLRDDLPRMTGDAARRRASDDAVAFSDALTSYFEATETLDELTGATGVPRGLEDLVVALRSVPEPQRPLLAGEDVDLRRFLSARDRAIDYVRGAFDVLNPTQRHDNLEAVLALSEHIDIDLSAADASIAERGAFLLRERAARRAAYDAALSAGVPDEKALRNTAVALFRDAPIRADGYLSSRIHAAKDVPVFNTAGAQTRMRYLTDALGDLGEYAVGSAADNAAGELAVERAELVGRRRTWERTMEDLYRTGLREFRKGFGRLEVERHRMRQELAADYAARSAIWDREYELFQNERVTEQSRTTEAALTSIRIPPLRPEGRVLHRVLTEGIDHPLLDELLRHAGRASDGVPDRRTHVAATLPRFYAVDAHRLALSLGDDIAEEIRSRTATVAALRLREGLEDLELRIEDQIDHANQTADRGFSVTLRSAGYRRRGSEYRRRAVIDESLFGGIESETHRIDAYRSFDAPRLYLTTDISAKGLAGLRATVVEARLQEARSEMERYMVLVFGRDDARESPSLARLIADMDGSLRSTLAMETARFAASAGYAQHKDREGLFAFHLGYAPVMDDNNPGRAAVRGYGETGRILEAYYRNEARLGRGLATLQIPWYDLKLYDDDRDNDGRPDSLFGAPTSRGIAAVSAGVVAGIASGGAGLGLLGSTLVGTGIGMVDDVAFGVADVASGRESWGSLGGRMGRHAALSVGTGLLSGVDYLADGSAFWDTMAGYGAVRAIELSGSAALRASLFPRNSSFFGPETIGQSVGAGIGVLARGSVAGLSQADRGAVSAVSGLLSDAGEATTDYLVRGRTTINVLNSREVFGAGNTGLLELSLGGNAAPLAVGSSGIDAGYSRLASAYRGRQAFVANGAIRGYQLLGRVDYHPAYDGSRRIGTALRALYSYGDGVGRDTLSALISGSDSLQVGAIDAASAAGRTIAAPAGGGRLITLSTLGDRGDIAGQLHAAVVLQHEAHRDGVSSGGYLQNVETARAILAHAAMASRIAEENPSVWSGRGSLAREVRNFADAMSSGDYSRFVAHTLPSYDATEDFWRVTSDGDIVYDRSKDLRDENGHLLREYEGSGGMTAALAEHLGISAGEANQLLVDAGFYRFEGGTFRSVDGHDVTGDTDYAVDAGPDFAARYNLQRDYVDRVADYGGRMRAVAEAALRDATTAYLNALRRGTITPELVARYDAAAALSSFSDDYDTTVYGGVEGAVWRPGLLNRAAAAAYDPTAQKAANQRIRTNWSQTDANPLYDLIEKRVVSPLVGPGATVAPAVDIDDGEIYITTRAFYPEDLPALVDLGLAGRPHGQSRGGIGVDIGTRGHELPVVLTQPEWILAQQLSLNRSNSAGGNIVQTESPLFARRSAHLADSEALQALQALMRSSIDSSVFRFELPAGYQIGNVGNTGSHTTGVHYHWEWIPR